MNMISVDVKMRDEHDKVKKLTWRMDIIISVDVKMKDEHDKV